MMAEGISLRAITRLTGISGTMLIKLLEDAGEALSEYQDRTLMNFACKRIQVDEAWAFCYAKQKNAPTAKAAPEIMYLANHTLGMVASIVRYRSVCSNGTHGGL
jgi:hypothetical protein